MNQNYRHRRKTGLSLLISYLLRGGAVLLAVLCVAALVWSGTRLAGLFSADSDPSASGALPPSQGNTSLPAGTSDLSKAPDTPNTPDSFGTPAVGPDPEPVIQVMIDAGHGGKDPGCVVGGTLEKDIDLQLALLLQEKLEAEGITVRMTRTEDTDMTMAQRVELANQTGALLYVSLHCNSFEEDTRVTGLECHYWQSEESLALAQTITQQVKLAGIKTRDVKTSEYVVLRDTEMPAVLIETGFLTNAQDRERLTSPEDQSVLMDAVVSAVKITLDRLAG